jgi:hypothetical protein
MGYRNYIGFISKNEYNKLKQFSFDDVIKYCDNKFKKKIKKLCVDFAKSKVPKKIEIKESVLFDPIPYYKKSAYNRAIDDFNKKINEEL